MSPSPALPPGVLRALRRLEKRLLAVLLAFGTGRVLLLFVGLLLALYALDRAFAPPPAARLVLGAAALALLGLRVRRFLWIPLRRRPGPVDLAALWERSHPDLHDALLTAVAAGDLPAGTSAELTAEVLRRAEAEAAALDPRRAAPSGRARRSLAAGGGAALALGLLASLFPGETRIFLDRLLGGATPWPRDTVLVLLPVHAEGLAEPPPFEELGGERYRLTLARGTGLTVRVQARGEVPEQVLALTPQGRRPLRSLGGGEFVLRIGALEEETVLGFVGGDDLDGLPELTLVPGRAPALVDWKVAVEPPAYTGVEPSESTALEFRVPAGTRLRLSFRTDLPVRSVRIQPLQGEAVELQPGTAGDRPSWTWETVARDAGEAVVELTGEDGFRNARAGVLRWTARADRPPSVEWPLPAGRWTTVDGGRVPLLLEAGDDYGLAALQALREDSGETLDLEEARGQREFRWFQVVQAFLDPGRAADGAGIQRFRWKARAADAAEPEAGQAEAESAWIEVVTPGIFQERQADRMARARETVERLLERTDALLEEAGGRDGRFRLLRRELDGLQADLEQVFLERLLTGLDPGSDAAAEPLLALLREGRPGPGAVTQALRTSGAPLPLEESRLLFELCRRGQSLREGPLAALGEALAASEDPAPAAAGLRAGLEELLEKLLSWQDFQSAVNLLRGLLERQRNLYLRTREAADR